MSRKKLFDTLEKYGIDAEFVDPGEKTATVVASSKVLGLSRKKIAKTLIFLSDQGVIVAIMRGDQRVSAKKLSKIVGAKKVTLAGSKTVRESTGYDVGGVPPVGHDHQADMTYVMDLKMLECDVVYAGGGDSRTLLAIKVKDIIRIVKPKMADISE